MRVCGLCLLCVILSPALAGEALAQRAKRGASSRVARAATFEADVRRLLKLTGAIEKELRSVEPLLESFKQQTPNVPEKVWEEVKAEFKKTFEAEILTGVYIKVYSRHFSHAEIRQLVSFYESPIGRRFAAETPKIDMELLLEGVEQGIDLSERIRDILKAKGYTMPAT